MKWHCAGSATPDRYQFIPTTRAGILLKALPSLRRFAGTGAFAATACRHAWFVPEVIQTKIGKTCLLISTLRLRALKNENQRLEDMVANSAWPLRYRKRSFEKTGRACDRPCRAVSKWASRASALSTLAPGFFSHSAQDSRRKAEWMRSVVI
jgi:hypothetical protein